MENEVHVFHSCLDGAQNAPPTGSTRFALCQRGPRLGTYFNRPDHFDVRIIIERDRMRSQVPDSDVRVTYRNDLDVPYR